MSEQTQDTCLPLINFHLASYPTEETGGYTPRQLKYGTVDANYFTLPEHLNLAPGVRAHVLIRLLDDNLQHIRAKSRELQDKLAAKRREEDKNISSYASGDLVLFNPREHPRDHLPTKLTPDWLGPYQVIQQVKNDVLAKHIVLHTEGVFHVERLKPFFGTFEQALDIARHDQHQFKIISINYFTGNPFIRTSMTFNVTFEDGTIDLPYGGDFISSQQFEDFTLAIPILFPLRFPANVALREVRKIEKLAITAVWPGVNAFVDFRIYDGRTSAWFDSLSLPDKTRPYITPITFTRWEHHNGLEIEAIVPIFGAHHQKYKLILSAYDVMAYVFIDWPYFTTNMLDFADRNKFPQLLA